MLLKREVKFVNFRTWESKDKNTQEKKRFSMVGVFDPADNEYLPMFTKRPEKYANLKFGDVLTVDTVIRAKENRMVSSLYEPDGDGANNG